MGTHGRSFHVASGVSDAGVGLVGFVGLRAGPLGLKFRALGLIFFFC